MVGAGRECRRDYATIQCRSGYPSLPKCCQCGGWLSGPAAVSGIGTARSRRQPSSARLPTPLFSAAGAEQPTAIALPALLPSGTSSLSLPATALRTALPVAHASRGLSPGKRNAECSALLLARCHLLGTQKAPHGRQAPCRRPHGWPRWGVALIAARGGLMARRWCSAGGGRAASRQLAVSRA